MTKVFQGLFFNAAGSPYYSPAVAMGQASSAMLEGWLISGNLNAAATLTLLGSNDQQQWTVITVAGPADVKIDLGATAPDYKESSAQLPVIGFSHVRIRLTYAGTGAGIVDAAIRPFQGT